MYYRKLVPVKSKMAVIALQMRAIVGLQFQTFSYLHHIWFVDKYWLTGSPEILLYIFVTYDKFKMATSCRFEKRLANENAILTQVSAYFC